MATLNAYLTATPSSTLSTANQLYTISGVPSVQENDTTLGTATGWSQIIAQGTTTAWSGLGSIGSPNGNGFFLDTTLLSGQKLLAGNYTATIHTGLKTVGPTVVIGYTMRLYKYNAGTYTPIVTLTSSTQTFSSSVATNVSLSGTGVVMAFGPSDRLYVDLWGNCTSNTSGSSTEKIRLADLSLDTSGLTGNSSAIITTPGYSPNSTTNSGDTLNRLRLLSTNLRSLSSRFVLGVSNTTSNISSRLILRNVTNQSGNTTFRAVMRALNQADVRSRFLLRSMTVPSTGVRARINALSSGDAALRLFLHSLSTSVGDVQARFSLRSTQLLHLSSRLLLRSPAKAMDLRSRFLLRSLSTGTDASMRLVLHSITTIAKDLATRLNLKLPVSGTPLASLATRLRLAFSGDTFNRANQSGLGTASDGETWTTLAGVGTYSIVSSKGQITGDQQNLQAIGLGTVTSYQDVEAIARFTPSSTSDIFGILLRSDNPASNFYRARFSGYVSQTIDIVKTASTNSTSMANASISITAGNAYWIKFRAVGAGGAGNTVNLFVKMWRDGTTEPSSWTVTYTDSSTPIGTGYCGLSFAVNANADTVKFDSYDLYAYRAQSSARDFATRFNLRAGTTVAQTIATRFRLLKPGDVTTRFRLATLHFVASRLHLMKPGDVLSRFRLGKPGDLLTRLRLGKPGDLLTRFRLARPRDLGSRLRLGQARDLLTRFRLGKPGDLLTRLRIGKPADLLTRLRIGKPGDLLTRFLLARPRDLLSRLRLGQPRDLLSRFRLGQPGDLRGRLLIQALSLGNTRLRALFLAQNQGAMVPTRVKLSALASTSNDALRLRLQSLRLSYAVLRLVLLGTIARDLSTRFIVHGINTVLGNTTTRMVLRAFSLSGLLARMNLLSTAIGQIATRTVLFGVPQPSASTRLRLMSASFRRYTATRFKLQNATSGMAASRLRLFATTTLALASRLRLISPVQDLFTAIRARIAALSGGNTSIRTVLRASQQANTGLRTRMQSPLQGLNIRSRMRLLANGLRDTATRLQLKPSTLVSDSLKARFNLGGATLRYLVSRLLLQGQGSSSLASRFRLFLFGSRDATCRLKLGFPPAFFQPPPLPSPIYSGPADTIPLALPRSGYSIGGTALDTPQIATTILPIYATLASDCTMALIFQNPSLTTQALLVNGANVTLTFPLLVGLPMTMPVQLQVSQQGSTWVVFATTQQAGGVQFR